MDKVQGNKRKAAKIAIREYEEEHPAPVVAYPDPDSPLNIFEKSASHSLAIVLAPDIKENLWVQLILDIEGQDRAIIRALMDGAMRAEDASIEVPDTGSRTNVAEIVKSFARDAYDKVKEKNEWKMRLFFGVVGCVGGVISML